MIRAFIQIDLAGISAIEWDFRTNDLTSLHASFSICVNGKKKKLLQQGYSED